MIDEADYAALRKIYETVRVPEHKTIFITGDAGRLMRYNSRGKQGILEAHLATLTDLLGPGGTIISPAASMNLCNTDMVFNLEETPSHQMGALAEFVRTRPGAARSFHPFWSVAALGANADRYTENVSRHSYAWNSPWQRMVEDDVLQVQIGKPPRLAVTLIHHIESVMNVPYRYTKEFLHPVRRNGEVSIEPFYMNVMYRDADIRKADPVNERILNNFTDKAELNTYDDGKPRAWSFSMKEFFDITTRLFTENIYTYLAQPPEIRPYQK